jgi:hypothetical protein
VKEQRQTSGFGKQMEKENHVKTMREQAQQLLSGKARWAPTWQGFQTDQHVMNGIATKLPARPSAAPRL